MGLSGSYSTESTPLVPGEGRGAGWSQEVGTGDGQEVGADPQGIEGRWRAGIADSQLINPNGTELQKLSYCKFRGIPAF